jgi:hypothetical protein
MIVASAVAALAAGGCGGSSGSASRVRAGAGRVCDRALARDARIQPPALPAQTPAFLRRGMAVLGQELSALRRLQAPSDQGGAYAAALHALTAEHAILARTVHDLGGGADPLSAIKTLQRRLAPVEADGDAAWRTLGVPACVTG